MLATSIPVVGVLETTCDTWDQVESLRDLTMCADKLESNYACPTGEGNETDASWAESEVSQVRITNHSFFLYFNSLALLPFHLTIFFLEKFSANAVYEKQDTPIRNQNSLL